MIKSLTIGTEADPANIEYAGLFGYIDGGTVKNVGLEDTYINIAISSAYAGGICGNNDSIISHCYNTGNVSADVDDDAHVGGICGYNYNGTV